MKKSSSNISGSLADYHIRNLRDHSRFGSLRSVTERRTRVVLIGIVTIVSYWFMDAGIMRLYEPDQSIWNLLILQVPVPTLFNRAIVTILIIGLAVLGDSLSEAIHLDRALKRSSKWFSTTLKSIGSALIAVDREGVVIFMNQFAQQLTGWRLADAVGRPLSEICDVVDIRKEGTNEYKKRLEGVIQKGAVYELGSQAIIRDSAGNAAPVAGTATAIKDGDEKIIGAVIVLHDLTAFKRAEATIHRLAKIVDQSDEMIFVIGVDGVVQYANACFEKTTGFECREIIAKHFRVFGEIQPDNTFYKIMERTMAKSTSWRGKLRFQTKTGKICRFQTIFYPIFDETGKLMNYVCVNRDITREVELQDMLNHSHKMEAMGRLAGGVAHDFKNILNAVGGFSSLIMVNLPKDHESYDYAKEISNAVESATALIQQLMTFSRKSETRPAVIGVNDKVTGLNKMFRQLVKSNVYLDLDLDQTKAMKIQIDPGQMDQVLLNLVINASDAMPDGGKIEIKTTTMRVKNDESIDQYSALKPGDYVKISIADCGPGIDEQVQTRIFEPFFTTKEEGKGTGLGLAIVYGIIKQNGGDIRVSSQPGSGTTFNILLPAVDTSTAGAGEAAV